MSNTLYDRDFYAWANEQAALLRAGRFNQADIDNIAEEIESIGRSEKQELISRLEVLLLHLLKWRHQPGHRGRQERLAIEIKRHHFSDYLNESPSLRSQGDALIVVAYRRAKQAMEIETGLPRDIFPPTSPFTFEQAMDENFWPD